jgi:hypothetical protein
MRKHFFYFFIFLCMHTLPIMAVDKSLENQITEVKELLEQEKIKNIELKAAISARESEAIGLRQELMSIEDQIKALKKEHSIN